jgi:hypothetical protein
MRKIRRVAVAVALGLCVAYGGRAGGSTISIEELARDSTFIVNARLESVHDTGPNGDYVRYVTARGEAFWKGDRRSITFIAPPAKPYDIVDTVLGDQVILFLRETNGPGSDLELVHEWSGCMPVRIRKFEWYVEISSDISWPSDLHIQPIPETDLGFRGLVSIAELRKLLWIVDPGVKKPLFLSNAVVVVPDVQNWEQGRRQPEGPARALLVIAAKAPDVVAKALAEAARRSA